MILSFYMLRAAFFLGLWGGCLGQLKTKEIRPITTCLSSEYFDITRNNCTACTNSAASGLVPDVSSLDVYGNAIACKCDTGFVEIDAVDCSEVSVLLTE